MIRYVTGCSWIVAAITFACAARADDASAAVARLDAPKKTLDLKTPDIRKLFTPEQINRVLSNIVDPDIEGVEVEGTREKLIFDKQPWWQRGPSWLLPRSAQDDKPDNVSVCAPACRLTRTDGGRNPRLRPLSWRHTLSASAAHEPVR